MRMQEKSVPNINGTGKIKRSPNTAILTTQPNQTQITRWSIPQQLQFICPWSRHEKQVAIMNHAPKVYIRKGQIDSVCRSE